MSNEFNESIYTRQSQMPPHTGNNNGNITILLDTQLREAIYSFLASVFLQPLSESSIRQIRQDIFLNDLVALIPGEHASALQRYLLSLDAENISNELLVLKQEYMSLFTVPTGRYVAPFEDIYMGISSDGQTHRGPLLGTRAIAAKRMYRQAGAHLEHTCKELPNHIGIELTFMQYLCACETTTARANSTSEEAGNSEYPQDQIYRAYQIRFLSEHLLYWYPLLNKEIQKKSSHTFYKSIANLTQDFLQHDLSMLKEQITKDTQR